MKSPVTTLLVIAMAFVAGCATPTPRTSPAAASQRLAAPTGQDIASLFDRWNESLQTGDPWRVVARYAEPSILLPTVSNRVRLTPEEKADYFAHFLENQPAGEITLRQIQVGTDLAVDTGLYTFRFAKTGEQIQARYSFTYRRFGTNWLIVSHHSSALPEK